MKDLVFEMAPEIVSDDETELVNGKMVKRKRMQKSLTYESVNDDDVDMN